MSSQNDPWDVDGADGPGLGDPGLGDPGFEAGMPIEQEEELDDWEIAAPDPGLDPSLGDIRLDEEDDDDFSGPGIDVSFGDAGFRPGMDELEDEEDDDLEIGGFDPGFDPGFRFDEAGGDS